MTEAMLLTLKLVIVLGIHKSGAVSLIEYQGGSANLSDSNPDHDYYLKLAERSLERKQPIGISISGDEIVEVVRADADTVLNVSEDQEKGRLKIWFQAHDGTFSLRYNHPDFQRISRLLKISKDDKKSLWFVARKPLLDIQDAVFLEPSPRGKGSTDLNPLQIRSDQNFNTNLP
jgi:hypothetical protein